MLTKVNMPRPVLFFILCCLVPFTYSLPQVEELEGNRLVVFDSIGGVDDKSDIFIMPLDGSHRSNLTNSPSRDQFPVWSPDGTQIAFVSDRDGKHDIFVMNADGSNPTNLTLTLEDSGTPAWSPDGTQIAFVSGYGADAEVYVMNVDGSNPQNITQNPGLDSEPTWSPDGQWLAFVSDRNGNQDIYKLNIQTGEVINLTNHPARDISPSWSPDDSAISFVSSRNIENELAFVQGGIYLMNTDGSHQVKIIDVTDNTFFSIPRWTPDGQSVIYSGTSPTWQYGLHLLDVYGTGEASHIVGTYDGDTSPDLQPIINVENAE